VANRVSAGDRDSRSIGGRIQCAGSLNIRSKNSFAGYDIKPKDSLCENPVGTIASGPFNIQWLAGTRIAFPETAGIALPWIEHHARK
jgi:hypothetical protein